MTPRAKRQLAAHRRLMPTTKVRLLRSGSAEHLVRARLIDFSASEIASGVREGSRKVIILAEGMTLDPPLREGDRLVIGDASLRLEDIDDQTRRIDGMLIAFEAIATGAR